MNEHAVRKMLEGGGGAAGALLRTGLWLPGKAYGLAMRCRRLAYRRGLLPSRRASLPVVSVGNLTAGGSGKTPFTVMLAQKLATRGRVPAVLLRGYRRSDSGESDEAVLYASLCPGLIVEVDADRTAGARRAEERGADVLLMDDGFQHLRLARNMDFVLIDATSPWGGGNTLPGGLLREPKEALRAASAVVITRSDQVPPPDLDRLRREIALLAPGLPLFEARHRPEALYHPLGGAVPLAGLRGRRVVALSGIARPEAFHRTLEDLGAEVAAVFAGRDHEHFDDGFLDVALTEGRRLGAVVVTTEKDGAKNIFASMTDNALDDNINVMDGPWILAVRQETEREAELLRLVERAIGGPE